jgi:hypothetical protein
MVPSWAAAGRVLVEVIARQSRGRQGWGVGRNLFRCCVGEFEACWMDGVRVEYDVALRCVERIEAHCHTVSERSD